MDGTGQPWVERRGPPDAATPLVCAVPHAGRLYPADLLRDSAVSSTVLEELEDRYADLLVEEAIRDGAVAIVARVARAWIDLNRAPGDLDPAMAGPLAGNRPSIRVRNGLGLIPRRLGGRELIARLPNQADVARRLAGVHAPYHDAIEAALAEARRRHGFAVLLDCHSMPPLHGGRSPRLVVGDRHGRSAARHVTAAATGVAMRSGFPAALNSPYAGAYTLDRHGRPADDLHALQLEVDRSLYLDGRLREPGEGLASLARLTARIGREAAMAARRLPAVAAE